ncbi:MAG TPA: hypothetical protein VFE36_13925 [Candidatus Baltobacteraceae bacterium]|nr:hypothetical protein [Candidatus Baltobacteraceae bacterium]
MGSPQPRSRDEMFVIRIWSESDRMVRSLWRASVTHVSSGQRHYFTNYGELCEFLDRWRARATAD